MTESSFRGEDGGLDLLAGRGQKTSLCARRAANPLLIRAEVDCRQHRVHQDAKTLPVWAVGPRSVRLLDANRGGQGGRSVFRLAVLGELRRRGDAEGRNRAALEERRPARLPVIVKALSFGGYRRPVVGRKDALLAQPHVVLLVEVENRRIPKDHTM